MCTEARVSGLRKIGVYIIVPGFGEKSKSKLEGFLPLKRLCKENPIHFPGIVAPESTKKALRFLPEPDLTSSTFCFQLPAQPSAQEIIGTQQDTDDALIDRLSCILRSHVDKDPAAEG